MEVLVAFIAFFAMTFGIVYLFYTTRNKERMALIEKGADASLFSTGKGTGSSYSWSKFTLKMGMLAIGVGIGIVVAAILDEARILPVGAMYPAMIFFFGGLSLVIFYLIDRKVK